MRPLRLLLAAAVTLSSLSGCGASDDDSDGSRVRAAAKRDETLVPVRAEQEQKPLFLSSAPVEGLAWKHLPLSQANTNALKCYLQDSLTTDQNQALGESIFFGGALGLIIQLGTGRPLLGHWKRESEHVPPEPASSPSDDFWLWHKFEENVKNPFTSILRGAAMGAACQWALTGLSVVSYPGLLGSNFESLSTSMFVGAMTLPALSPAVRYIFGRANPEAWVAGNGGDFNPPANWFQRVTDAFRTSGAGKVLRYKVAPGLTIFFLGAGVALWTYKDLQNDSRTAPPSQQECEQVNRLKPLATYQLSVPVKAKAY